MNNPLSKRANRLQRLRLKAMKETAAELDEHELWLFFSDLVDSHHHLQAENDDLRGRVAEMESLWANADMLVLDAVNQTRGVVGGKKE